MSDFCGIPGSRLICRVIRAVERELETFYVTPDEIKLIKQAIKEYSSSSNCNNMLVMDISSHLNNICEDMLIEYRAGRWHNNTQSPLYLLPSEINVVIDILEYKDEIAEQLETLIKYLNDRYIIIQGLAGSKQGQNIPSRSDHWNKIYTYYKQRLDGVTFGQRTLPRNKFMYRRITMGYPYSSQKKEMYEAMYHCNNIYDNKEEQEICEFICNSITESLLYEGEDYIYIHIFETQYIIDTLKNMREHFSNNNENDKRNSINFLLNQLTPIPLNFSSKESKEYEKFMALAPAQKMKKIQTAWKEPFNSPAKA